jgi:hypothetical protein
MRGEPKPSFMTGRYLNGERRDAARTAVFTGLT